MPVNARFVLLLAFVHSSAFAAAVPLDSRRVSDTVIEDGTPLGVSNRYHHFADARDVPVPGRYLRRSPQVSPPVSAFGTASGTASKVLGARDPPGPGPGPEAAAAGPSPAKAGPPPGPPPPMFGPPGPQGPPGPSSPPSPLPYPYPYPYPFPYPEHEHEREHEYPHDFHNHEEFMDREGGHMYHEYPAPHEYPYHHDDFPRPHDYPYDDFPRPHREDGYVRYHHFEDLHATDYPHDEFRRPHDDFSGPPHDRYPGSHDEFWRPGDEFEDGQFRGQRGSQREKTSGQRTEGQEIAPESKKPNSLSLPSASSVDLASAQLPPRAETEASGAPSNLNDGPNISGLFSSLGNRGDSAVPADSPQLEAREDIGLPLPDNMSLGKISSRAAKGNEVNEVAVEDHRTNPVEKLVTL
jgi:hypothetical protein